MMETRQKICQYDKQYELLISDKFGKLLQLISIETHISLILTKYWFIQYKGKTTVF